MTVEAMSGVAVEVARISVGVTGVVWLGISVVVMEGGTSVVACTVTGTDGPGVAKDWQPSISPVNISMRTNQCHFMDLPLTCKWLLNDWCELQRHLIQAKFLENRPIWPKF